MSLNPQETYSPGSMLKVVNLLIYLKLSEKEPGLLDKKIVYQTPEYPIPVQTFNTSQIEAGKEYTIRDLLKYMIVYSDNRATCWLVANLDSKVYFKMMEDLKIPLPSNTNYVMTASQYSVLFKLLYSSRYLSNGNSEFALRLLNQSDFKNGLVRDLPGNVQVAHKFGEAGGKHQHQLHESGLIYMNYAPYLITIMTKGYAIDDLPPVISTISKMVYDDLSRIEE
jgi:beta-lactamase class A